MTRIAYDVVIVGAGIVGAAVAAECAREGMSVAVIEASMIAGGATAAGMGHIVVMDDSEAQFALTRYSQILWDELSEEMPREGEYEAPGTIWVAADDEEMAEVRRKEKFYEERGVATEVLDARSLAEAEPNLRSGLAGGILIRGDSVIYPPAAARFLLEQARAHGADLLIGQPVIEIDQKGVRLRDGSRIPAHLTVNAAGTWAGEIVRGIDVEKRKGHLVITDRYPGFARHQLVEIGYLKSAHSLRSDSVAFNIQPRRTGQMLIGSSRQYGVESSAVDSHILGRMIGRAIEYMPKLLNLSAIRVWTGFRAATPDNLPLIGPHPDQENLYLATGHEGLGITTSLGTARLLVDQLLGRPPAIPIAPYLPSRTKREVTHA
ncbi:MAG TPA: FAD-dependent oxidoreductase [Blastocatellia bacterium]|nr:FAD-dependent oxidoreductase [Blastocatellia bacterium]